MKVIQPEKHDKKSTTRLDVKNEEAYKSILRIFPLKTLKLKN